MERALLPRVCRALWLCRAGLRFCSTRGPSAPSGAEEGAPRGRDSPASLPQHPGAVLASGRARGDPGQREQSGAGRGSRTGQELLRAQQDLPRAGKGKGPQRKALSLERTKGSEILFGTAPCWLALAQARRALFRLFLKHSSGSARPVRGEFALQAAARGVPVLHVSGRELDVLCRGRPHQGVCLEASPLPFKSLRDAEEPQLGDGQSGRRQLLWLVLEHIQDPMNLGALLRSAYFLGVDRVVASHRNSCPLTPIVSKASAGVMEVFDVYGTDDLQGFLKAKSAEGWEVVGTVSRPGNVEDVPVISCSEFRWDKPIIVVIGSEGEGLSLETQLQCQQMLAIPPGRALHPSIDSLNVSVAAGILLHSICSQKRRHGD
ncbi:rRNA methyltransferase 1, mitochondrial [Corvus hawaiiensis]|uniref:rRNA methyltransferase 1, mitochondrial n=4 Tax=Corvus TaxID=30420 RepID=A0A8C3F0G2_CORMO|nr:rRNA methyltransferase 1, mitochondrial [Corvus moneduloides]XP_048180787.1 rRNA methyltransferase 1, mitochondrial [Corvus hawaiiensis]